MPRTSGSFEDEGFYHCAVKTGDTHVLILAQDGVVVLNTAGTIPYAGIDPL